MCRQAGPQVRAELKSRITPLVLVILSLVLSLAACDLAPPQIVQIGGQATELEIAAIQVAFYQVDILDAFMIAGFKWNATIDDTVGHGGAQQPGEIGFQAPAQAAQRIGAGFVLVEAQLAQSPLYFRDSGLFPQRRCQLLAEFPGTLQ